MIDRDRVDHNLQMENSNRINVILELLVEKKLATEAEIKRRIAKEEDDWRVYERQLGKELGEAQRLLDSAVHKFLETKPRNHREGIFRRFVQLAYKRSQGHEEIFELLWRERGFDRDTPDSKCEYK